MSTSNGPFVLSRAKPEDMLEMTKLQYACFPPFVRLNFMGCHSEADIPKITDIYIKAMSEDPADIWIKVTDPETGKIIAGADWKVYMSVPQLDAEHMPPWLEGKEAEESREFIKKMSEGRWKAMDGKPYIYLHICYTDDAYRRRGAGGMMLKWGCDLADQLSLPGYIEASPEGSHLYRAFGFYDAGKIEWEEDAVVMKRDPQATEVRGGKPKPS
ncbi:hypothetical protein LTR95_014766 [Oleoguttula sp. CCFEE 5521]